MSPADRRETTAACARAKVARPAETGSTVSGGILVLALSALGFPALAQQAPGLTSPISRETQLSLTADVLYDSNVARSDEALAAQRGLKLADEIFTPGATFVVARQYGEQILFLNGHGSYDFHDVNSVLNREVIDVNGGVNAHLARCQEVATGEYNIQQRDLADQSYLGVVKNLQDTTSVSLAAQCGHSIGFAPNASIMQSWLGNSSPIFFPINQHVLTATAGLSYRQPAIGSLTFSGSYSQAGFPQRPNPDAPPGQTFAYAIYSGTVTYDRHLGGRLEGAVSVSYTTLDPNTPLTPKFNGVTYSLDAIYNISSRLALHVSTVRQTTPSNRIDANYSVDEIYESDIQYKLGTRLMVSVTGLRRLQNYHTDLTGPLYDLTQITRSSVFATATYALTRHLSVAFTGGDEEGVANYPGLSYSSTRFGMRLKSTF